MSRLLRFPLLAVCGVVAVLGSARISDACGCRRVYTSCSWQRCIATPTIRTCGFSTATCPTTGIASCPIPNVERCYLEPQTTYVTQSRLEAQVRYVRRSYYDPVTCCYQTYWEPATQYVERAYQVPLTRWVRRCSAETTATNPLESLALHHSYYVPTALPERQSPRAPAATPTPLPLDSEQIQTAPHVSPSPTPMPLWARSQSGVRRATNGAPGRDSDTGSSGSDATVSRAKSVPVTHFIPSTPRAIGEGP